MARWGKNFVVPLESLIKEKENTNRPIAARSAGTVGKWGKMGFTSIRTYAFKAAAVAGVSPSEVIPENNDVQNNSQSSDPPKPKKFFKSRNASVDMIRTQIQHLPRAPPSPIRDVSPKKEQQVIKIKIPKPKHERKKSTSSDKGSKPKKKKEGKKLKPEAPPSRVTSRQRKVVNYKEDDEDERSETPLKDIVSAVPAALTNSMMSSEEEQNNQLNTSNETSGEYDGEIGEEEEEAEPEIESEHEAEAVMEPPPVTPSKQQNPDHPPIVLRISKGTSRLISTDSEEVINSPVQQSPAVEQLQQTPVIASTEELLSVLSGEPVQKQQIKEQLIIKTNEEEQFVNATKEPEVNNIDESRVSPNAVENQKYESLKIVIKTDALKNAFISEKPEKKSKSRKHKKVTTAAASTATLKTPSPKPSSENRTLMSPPPPSEKDFDSQSSILGSVSSKGTNQFPAVIAEDSCVIRSHGSSDITSDLETSQHSSLVAPPSDIESRLESMMDCDDDLPPLEGVVDSAAVFGGNDNKLMHIREEPLKEDILKVLTEDGTEETEEVQKPLNKKEKKTEEKEQQKDDDINKSPSEDAISTRRVTRSRRGKVETESEQPVTETPVAPAEEKSPNKTGRVTRNNNNGNLKNNSTVLPPTRSYARKRKNVQPAPPLAPPPPPPPLESEQNNEEENDAFAVDLPDASSTIQMNDKYQEKSTKMEQEVQDNSEITTFLETPPKILEKLEEKEYKVKNKLKRTWYERNSKRTRGGEGKTDEPVAKKFNSRGTNNEETMAGNNNNNKTNEQTIENGETFDDDLSPLRLTNSSSSIGGNDDEKPSVKLVISKKKGSIFKSRALVSDQGGDGHTTKKRAVYKHTWDDDKEKSSCSGNTPTPSDSGGDTLFEDDFSNDTATITKFSSRITRQNIVNSGGNNDKFSVGDDIDNENGITKVKCDRKAKDYYTVVRNVKTAHQIQEIGEYQEMKDDVDYILDALQPHNPISTRCLSALQLATKCLIPAFRMHVRAHGTVGKFFKALKDAKNDLSLGLCTATIMFALAQDTLNVDLDRDSLELMINLLEIDSKNKKKDSTPTIPTTTTAQIINSSTDSEENTIYERNKQKVRELCEEIKNQGKALHLNLDTITVGTLSMETLLSLTSKKAGEWFKEELRELGGLEHIIKTICDCCYQITDYVVNWTEYLLDKLRTIERCLRVLENVSQQNEINQKYILSYNNGYALDTLFKLYKLCDSEIALYPTTDQTPKDNPGVVLRETLVPTLKVLINLTHPFDTKAIGSSLLGQRQGIFDTSFHILLQAPNYVPERCIFELSILVLLLLINLTMYTIPNRQLIMKSHAPSDFGNRFDKVPAIKALIEYFYRCQEQALLAEQNTDEILENPESNKKKPQSQEEMDETVTKLLQKAGHHMEHTLQASYAGILIGHLISENSENETIIRSYLRNNKFEDIVSVLKKYYTFMDLTASSEATVVSHIKSTKNLIDNFVKCDAETTTTTITTTHSNNDNDDIGNISGNINENHHHHYNQLNNNSTNLDNSQNQLPSSSSQNSSISTRSATRYYKSYSGQR